MCYNYRSNEKDLKEGKRVLDSKLKKYVDLIVTSGLDVQKDDYILVTADVKTADFVLLLTEAAYNAGAAEVVVDFTDERLLRQKGLHGKDEIFDIFPESRKLFFEEQLGKKAKRMSIASPNPDVLGDVDSSRLMRLERVMREGMVEYRKALMGDHINWTIAAVANQAWAEKVFPNVDKSEALGKLWDAIFDSVHLNDGEDANENWMNHVKKLWQRSETLNEMELTALHYTNELGTDLIVGLPKGHVWLGGGATNVDTNTFFSPNMPTEEVYTLGDANRVDGVVYSALPLLFSGQMIDNFYLEFKDGAVVKAVAKQGDAMLQEILKTDDGSRRIGEVALVPYQSPISLSGLLFYNTLYDENASCHFALGAAYSNSLPASIDKTADEKKAMGFNESVNHVDFMVGTKDLNIKGIKADGTEIDIFVDGNFAF